MLSALLVWSLNENLAGRSGELCQLWTRNCEFSLERWKVFYINHFQKPHLTESDNIGVEDDEAEAEDDSDAEVEPNRRIQLAAEISVKPTGSFFYKKCQRVVGIFTVLIFYLPARDEDPENGNCRIEMRRLANRKLATSNPEHKNAHKSSCRS